MPHNLGETLLGLTKGFKPRFLRQYLNLFEEINFFKDYKQIIIINQMHYFC